MDVLIVFHSAKFKNSCKKIAKGLADELFQHVILIILELKSTDIIDIEAYAVSIAFSEFYNKKSKFNKQLGINESNELTGVEVVEQTINIDEQHEVIIKIIDKEYYKSIKENRFPVGHELFKKYVELKTIRNVAKFFNMSRSTVHRHIKEHKENINKKYEKTI